MTTAPADSFAAIDLAWTLIQDGFAGAYTSASDEQKPKVQAVRDMARDAWYSAVNRSFHQTDALVVELTADLQGETAVLQKDGEALKTATVFLDIAKSAAKTAAALSKLAI